MYAIVEIAGQQFKVENGQEIYVHRLPNDEGTSVSFDRVLLVAGDAGVRVGSPTVSGASVAATVLNHAKGDKVLVFKKKPQRLSKNERSSPVIFKNPDRSNCIVVYFTVIPYTSVSGSFIFWLHKTIIM